MKRIILSIAALACMCGPYAAADTTQVPKCETPETYCKEKPPETSAYYYTCQTRDLRGRIFTGYGVTPELAQYHARAKCRTFSAVCFDLGCYIGQE